MRFYQLNSICIYCIFFYTAQIFLYSANILYTYIYFCIHRAFICISGVCAEKTRYYYKYYYYFWQSDDCKRERKLLLASLTSDELIKFDEEGDDSTQARDDSRSLLNESGSSDGPDKFSGIPCLSKVMQKAITG